MFNRTDITEHTHNIPDQKIIEVFSKIDAPIISVGSGNGVIEYKISKILSKEVICVDPMPESFDEYPSNNECIKPSFPLVQDLVNSLPIFLIECCLFLNWALPNESTYDYEAIKVLKPKYIVVVYETIGAAGGDLFHEWTKKQKEYNKEVIDEYSVSIRKFGKVFVCQLVLFTRRE